MVEKGVKVVKVVNEEREAKEVSVTTKISPKNHGALVRIKGWLESTSGKNQSVDDAVTYVLTTDDIARLLTNLGGAK